MIQLTPQMRILVAVQPQDFRNYPEHRIMWSTWAQMVGLLRNLSNPGCRYSA
jgi:hypothetical protein